MQEKLKNYYNNLYYDYDDEMQFFLLFFNELSHINVVVNYPSFYMAISCNELLSIYFT